jgi:hypothetical protein
MRRPGCIIGFAVGLALYFVVTWFYPFTVFNPLWMVYLGTGYSAALRNGPNEIQPVGEFVEVFPQAEHLISYYTGDMGPPTWHSAVGLHGRYVLAVEVPITFDWTRRHVRSYGKPKFYLREVEKIEGRTIDYRSESQRDFGPEEWVALYRANGSLEVLGLRVVEDDPIRNFDLAWRHN